MLPQELRDASVSIQSRLTKLQQSIKQLEKSKMDVGSESDNYDMRQALIAKMTETNGNVKALKQELEDFEQISVNYNQEKTKKDKHRAFETVFLDLAFKYDKLSNEINIKMKQFLDLAMERKQTLYS